MVAFFGLLNSICRFDPRWINGAILQSSVYHSDRSIKVLFLREGEVVRLQWLALLKSFLYWLLLQDELDLELTAMDLHLKHSLTQIWKFSASHHALPRQDIVDHLWLTQWNFGWFISQENRRFCMFFCMYCQEIIAPLTKFRLWFIEHKSILEIAVITKLLQIDFLLLHKGHYLLRTCLVEVEFDVAVLVQGDDLESLIRKMLKSIEFYIVLCQITIPQYSSLQFDDMILSLRKGCWESIGAIFSSSNSNIIIFCRLRNIHNHLPVKRFLHMPILIRVFQRTQIQLCTVKIVIRNLHQQTSTVFDCIPVISFRILDQITCFRDWFLQFDKILSDFNSKINNSPHFFLRIDVN